MADGLPLDFRDRITKVSLQAEANVAPKLVSVHVTRVGDGYLNTMGIPLLRGRGFTVDDSAGAEMVTIISKPLADQLFPNAEAAEAIGKRLTFGRRCETDAANPHHRGCHRRFPHFADEHGAGTVAVAAGPAPGRRTVFLIARSAAGEQPMKLTAALENAVRDLGPDFNRTSRRLTAWPIPVSSPAFGSGKTACATSWCSRPSRAPLAA